MNDKKRQRYNWVANSFWARLDWYSLRRAIDQLRSEGYQLEFIRVEGMSHSRVLEELSRADLVVDQLLIGAPGVFTLEAWSHGTPVACYFCDDVINDYDCEPVLNCNPDNIYSILKDVLGGRLDLEHYSRLGSKVFNTFHSPSSILDMMVDLYSNKSTKITGSNPIITKPNLIIKKYPSWNLKSYAESMLDRSLPVSSNSFVRIVYFLSSYIVGQLSLKRRLNRLRSLAKRYKNRLKGIVKRRWRHLAGAFKRIKQRVLGGIKRRLNRLRSLAKRYKNRLKGIVKRRWRPQTHSHVNGFCLPLLPVISVC